MLVERRADRPPHPIQRHPQPSPVQAFRGPKNPPDPPSRPIARHRHRITCFTISKLQHPHRRRIQPPQVDGIPGIVANRCFRRQNRQRGHGQNRGRRRALRSQQHRTFPRNETSIDTAGNEIRMRDDAPEQIKVAGDSRDGAIVQRLPQPAQRRLPRRAVTNQLRQHGIVMDRHRIAGREPGIHPHAIGFSRRAEQRQPPDRRSKIPRRILGIDPRLDGMAGQCDRRLIHR